ncbi:MAG TPA: hypothetical protein VF669_12950 [Tepidisphaeraceae bacterium]
MTSRLHPSFQRQLAALPKDVQERARSAYKQFVSNPRHPSLQFKQLNAGHALWSVRVTNDYRAVGVRSADKIIWFFIGTHAQYDRLLKTYR